MVKYLIKLWCFLKGHNWLPLYSLNNADLFEGQWRSAWGCHKCMRCEKEKHWQYDRQQNSTQLINQMTKIEWTDTTWSPVTGCTKVSVGCKNCYAERMSKRLAGRFGYPPAPDNFKVTLHPDRLNEPLKWKKPRKIFVCSMSDLFHEKIPYDFIIEIFHIMAKQHTYQILTKRPEIMYDFMCEYIPNPYGSPYDPLPNVWLGVSVEDVKAKIRIDILRPIPAAVRFISFEPLLEDVGSINLDGIHWVIVGSESGPNARPTETEWVRSIRDQCRDAGVPFFLKQLHIGKKKVSMPELDGKIYSEMPI